jgi:hypothetical protein
VAAVLIVAVLVLVVVVLVAVEIGPEIEKTPQVGRS